MSNHVARRFRLGRRSLATVLLLTATLASAQSDAPSPAADDVFVESTDVVLVNVDVWVADRNGEPVTGLGPDDFVLLEDGEPVAISHFAELRDGTLIAEPTGAPADRPQVVADTPARPIERPREDMGHLIVYFDDIHLAPRSRKAAFEALREFFAEGTVPPHRISMLRQDTDLVTVAPFGSTEAELNAALDSIEEHPAGARELVRQRQRLIDEIQRVFDDEQNLPASDSPCANTRRRTFPLIQQHALEAATRVVGTLGHLWNTADYLAGLPGNKVLLYVGEGLEMVPGAAHERFLEELCTTSEPVERRALTDYGLNERYLAFTRHANSARITVHTIDAGGLRASAGFDVEAGFDARPGATASFERTASRDLESGLHLMADATGGRAALKSNDLVGALDNIGRDLGTRYSLAYVPDHGGDGERHTIDVELREDRRGLTIRHRRDYRDWSADERLAARVRTALFAGFVENPLDARFGWGAASDGPEGRIIVPLRVRVPVDRLVFLPEDGVELARITLLAAVRDASGDMVSFTERKPVLERPPEGMEALPLRIDVEVPAGEHVVAVAIRDDVTRTTSVLAAPFELERASAGSAR